MTVDEIRKTALSSDRIYTDEFIEETIVKTMSNLIEGTPFEDIESYE